MLKQFETSRLSENVAHWNILASVKTVALGPAWSPRPLQILVNARFQKPCSNERRGILAIPPFWIWILLHVFLEMTAFFSV